MANISKVGAPDIHTIGAIGDTCTDSKTGSIYKCVGISKVKTDEGTEITYSWSLISDGSSSGSGSTGPQGPAGEDGKSAYQIWLDAGNTGTEAEFLSSLKGEKGDTGATGPQGPAGEDGKAPVKGTDYFTDEDKSEIVQEVKDAIQEDYTMLSSTNTRVKNLFALQRTGKVYTVKFPLWETSTSSEGEKLDDNNGLICLPSTAAEYQQNDYDNIPLFKTYDCNAHVNDKGMRIIDALKDDENYKDTGDVDVFVLGMSYYEKYWIEDGYWYYSRTDLPKDGYTLALECRAQDGSDQGFGLYGKYITGVGSNGKLYSAKNLIPARYCGNRTDSLSRTISYSGNINLFNQKGTYYSGGMMCDYKYIITTFYLMMATINTQSIVRGCSKAYFQYLNLNAESATSRIIISNSQASDIEIGSYVSIGDNNDAETSPAFYQWVTHNLAECVKVIGKEAYDDSNTAVIVDATFDSTLTTRISSVWWKSGFSDLVLGRFGSPCQDITGLTNGKYPIVFQGIELMVGGYETVSNMIMDIVDSGTARDVYIINDATKITNNVDTIKSTYTKLGTQMTINKLNAWDFITHMDIDLENGAVIASNSGGDGSGNRVGYADAVYASSSDTSGQRECLLFGYLSDGMNAGLSCIAANRGLSEGSWNIITRLSINGVGVA